MSRYVHRPLDHATREIRLLRVEKSTDDLVSRMLNPAPITLTLEHAHLGTAPPFNALSYMWGDNSVTFEVEIRDNGAGYCDALRAGEKRMEVRDNTLEHCDKTQEHQQDGAQSDTTQYEIDEVQHEKNSKNSSGPKGGILSVREHLYEFLCTARDSNEEWSTQWIWIDQICIDQDNLKERCHQVGQMGELYSIAASTIVWPGSTRFLEELGLQDLSVEDPFSDSESDWNDCLDSDSDDDVEVELGAIDPKRPRDEFERTMLFMCYCDGADFEPFFKRLTAPLWLGLFLSPYWTRVWVIQEIILASTVKLLIKERIWELSFLIKALTRVRDVIFIHRILVDKEAAMIRWLFAFLRLSQFEENRRLLPTGRSTWIHAFQLSEDAQSQVPHDHVFGVMGLVEDDLRPSLDYSATPGELLRAVLQREVLSDVYSGRELFSYLHIILRCWNKIDEFRSVLPEEPVSIPEEDSLSGWMETSEGWDAVHHEISQVFQHLGLPIPDSSERASSTQGDEPAVEVSSEHDRIA